MMLPDSRVSGLPSHMHIRIHSHILTGIIMTYTHTHGATHTPQAHTRTHTQIQMSAKVYCIATFELQHSMSEVCCRCRCGCLCRCLDLSRRRCGPQLLTSWSLRNRRVAKFPLHSPEIRRRALRQRANNNGPYVLYNERPCT